MVSYKWQLRKSSKKEFCPACGKKRFVPYVLASDCKTIARNENGVAIYGRCDREQNCGYHLYPKHTTDEEYTPPVVQDKKPGIRFAIGGVRTDTQTALFEYACKLTSPHNALRVWNEYKIGRDGQWTVFWQIDKNGEVRTGKEILYSENGHRRKDVKYPAMWTHKLQKWSALRSGDELQQCFFGEHLLTKYPTAKVCIVESEKTAALMSAYTSPEDWVWLASGGSQGLSNEEKNAALKGREVYLCPDNKQYYKWLKVATKQGWRIFDQIERYPVFEGCDILDMVEAGAFGSDLIFYAKLK